MGKWRNAFESNLKPVDKRDHFKKYHFGKPVTQKQIKQAEKLLDFRLPKDVREMLAEFNGVWSTCYDEGDDKKEIVYLDTDELVTTHRFVAEYAGLPEEQTNNVLFVYQNDGRSTVVGVCVDDVGEFKAGEIVYMEHEEPILAKLHDNLLEFVSKGWK